MSGIASMQPWGKHFDENRRLFFIGTVHRLWLGASVFGNRTWASLGQAAHSPEPRAIGCGNWGIAGGISARHPLKRRPDPGAACRRGAARDLAPLPSETGAMHKQTQSQRRRDSRRFAQPARLSLREKKRAAEVFSRSSRLKAVCERTGKQKPVGMWGAWGRDR